MLKVKSTSFYPFYPIYPSIQTGPKNPRSCSKSMMVDLGGGVSMSTRGVYEGLGFDEFIPEATYKVRDFSFDPGMGEAERAARADVAEPPKLNRLKCANYHFKY